MARNGIQIPRLDENTINRHNVGNQVNKENRRVALGDIVNKQTRTNINKERVIREKNVIKPMNVKPKVDCHRKEMKVITEKLKQTKVITKTSISSKCVADKLAKPNLVKKTSIPTKKLPEAIKIKTKKLVDNKENDETAQIASILIVKEPNHVRSKNDPQMVSEYVYDIYNYLYEIESIKPIKFDYLNNHTEITKKMRSVLIDWINEVHNTFATSIETYFLTVNIIDRYLQLSPKAKRRELQLVGITALCLASKYEDIYPNAIQDFVYITDNTYTSDQIRKMEILIFKTLDFDLNRPLAIQFLRRYSKLGKVEVLHATAKYFLELISIEYEMVHIKASQMAAASLLLALLNYNNTCKFDEVWTPALAFNSTYNVDALKPITIKIATIVKNAFKSKLQSVVKRYNEEAKSIDEILLEKIIES